jgi:hypothetical protein
MQAAKAESRLGGTTIAARSSAVLGSKIFICRGREQLGEFQSQPTTQAVQESSPVIPSATTTKSVKKLLWINRAKAKAMHCLQAMRRDTKRPQNISAQEISMST